MDCSISRKEGSLAEKSMMVGLERITDSVVWPFQPLLWDDKRSHVHADGVFVVSMTTK
jgi:hypothetical protein